ncbi:hypothetical protein [Sphingomonas japonica]|uniref:Uncharacterized protein n=1 Tax=Sphingomonas japonica TaxID=511662 RepID=A0ABX0U2A2_9SPHN|nr:hypothetical protein [Sphingomonas japonica]NIJ24205.1 hypothetical protein [Sphingomonas japonica]
MGEKIKNRIANDVAAKLIPAEAAVDETLTHLLALGATLMRAHGQLNLPIGEGAGIINRIGDATALGFEMRRKMCSAHVGLRAKVEEMGLQVTAGPITDCPEKAPMIFTTGELPEASTLR